MQQLFGTDGIRARVGISPLTPHELVTLGAAIAVWTITQHTNPRILLAHDTRHSSSLLKASLKAGLLQYPLTVHDATVLPTPALFHQVVHGPYDFGIMITASHNPYHDNGIKIMTKENGKLTATDEHAITALFYQNPYPVSYESLGTEQQDLSPSERYLAALSNYFPEPFLQGITLVVDCAQGAYANLAPAFLKKLGASIINLATAPNGKNINANCGSLHPQTLQEMVKTTGAHAGFAFDGDGDRLVAVAQDGTIKDGDELLAFLLNHPTYQYESDIVGTIMSNQGCAAHLQRMAKTLHRTPVGDKHVVEKMKACGSLIGGEPSGHLILRDFTDTSDGLFTLLKIAETACHNNDWNFTSFTKFPHVLLNVPVGSRKDLSHHPYVDIIAAHEEKLTEGRVVVRYSGTEPLLRIMVEAQSSDEAHTIGVLLSQQLTEALTKE